MAIAKHHLATLRTTITTLQTHNKRAHLLLHQRESSHGAPLGSERRSRNWVHKSRHGVL